MKFTRELICSALLGAVLALFTVGPPAAAANPFVEYHENEKVAGAADPAQSRGVRYEPVAVEPAKDIRIMGLVGSKVAVTIDGRLTTVWDGAEIGPCLIAYPEVLCTEKEKARHKKQVTSDKINKENVSLRKKAVTLEKAYVDLYNQVSFYDKAVELAALLDDGEDVYIPLLAVTARTITGDDKTLRLRTDISKEKVAGALYGKASEVYGFAGYTYAVIPGGLP